MYIDDIDKIWDETINNYFTVWIIQRTKELINIDTIQKETNFVKFQKEINKTFDLSFSIISQDKIKSIVTKNSNIDLINNIVKKYICYYFFIFIGVIYKDKFDLFNNNLIEFGRNQANYEIKIDNFFTSESNSNIIKITLLIKEFIDFIDKIYLLSKKDKNKSKLSRTTNSKLSSKKNSKLSSKKNSKLSSKKNSKLSSKKNSKLSRTTNSKLSSKKNSKLSSKKNSKLSSKKNSKLSSKKNSKLSSKKNSKLSRTITTKKNSTIEVKKIDKKQKSETEKTETETETKKTETETETKKIETETETKKTETEIKEDEMSDLIKYTTILKNYSIELNNFLLKNNLIDTFLSLYESNIINKKDEVSKNVFYHTIIKTVIYLKLYYEERKEIFSTIENSEISTGEYVYIDVVVPQSIYIDYDAIETILNPDELKTDYPDIIYKLLNEDYSENLNDKRKYYSNLETKIQKLLDTKLLIPIVDDFLLYHKDNEKYEKQTDKIESPKKKDETKIKYIINKINTYSEYYRNPSEIKKLQFVPLQDRNAITVNVYEDVKIVSKMINIIKLNIENLDLFNDLISYREYPYIAFKDFEKNGFIFNDENTNIGLRKINFYNLKKNKFESIQTRTITTDLPVNIVGFAMINNYDEIDCLTNKNFINIADSVENPITNITTLLESKIRSSIFRDKKKLEDNYYWLFDLEKNKYFIPNYDISESMPKNDIVKIITAYLYDFTIETIINIFKNNILKEQSKYIFDYINSFDNLLLKYPDLNNQLFAMDIDNLQNIIYYDKSKKNTNLYDENEDEFPGLFGNILKLPTAPKKPTTSVPLLKIFNDFKDTIKEKKILLIRDYDNEIDENEEAKEYMNARCQHNVSWDLISLLKKENQSLYSKLTYSFMQQYVEVSETTEYRCKSCKSPLDVKKFINDGMFDNASQSFVTFSVHMDVNIEDLPEYEKYKTAIRNIDKLIEKISSILVIHGFTGQVYSNRSNRKVIMKDTIDIILNHNVFLKSSYLSKRDKNLDRYGLNKILSNLFFFELDNNIFVYSSKEKDVKKIIKYNNVIGYIIILLILELNESQILSLKYDKICSYAIFKRIGYSLFENINLVVNKSGDLKPIKNYTILCYLIYLFTCFITKYNLWADTLTSENVKSKKFNPLIQKSAIHTVVELLNSLLIVDEDYFKKNKLHIYEVLSVKYYLKLDMYQDINIIRKLDQLFLGENINKDTTINVIDNNKYDILPNYIIPNNFMLDDLFVRISLKYLVKKYIIPYQQNDKQPIHDFSNLTNCIEGAFHSFTTKDKKLICKNCNVVADLKLVKDSKNFIFKELVMNYYKRLAKKYCLDGSVHSFEYIAKEDTNVCKKCKYKEGQVINYKESDLEKMYLTVEKIKKENNLFTEELLKKLVINNEEKKKTIKKTFDKLTYKFQKNDNDINNSLNILLDNIQKLLGVDILIGNEMHNLTNNIFIIDHDYNGVKLDEKIQIYDKDNKFRIIENHTFYKRDVLVFTIQKNTKYEVFYDLHKKYLLGYREVNKDYHLNEKPFSKIKISYSIKNLFLMFGFTRQYVDIRDFYPDLIGYSEDKINDFKESFNMTDFVNKVCFRRTIYLKKLGYELLKYINRINFQYNIKLINNPETNPDLNSYQIEEFEIINNPLDIIYNKFLKKFESNITTTINKKQDIKKQDTKTKTEKHLFLKHMNTIIDYLPFNNIKENPKFTLYTEFTYFIKKDFNSNMILNYITDEFIRLLSYNDNKTIKTNTCLFMLEIVNKLFELYNLDIATFDKDVDHFNQILYTSEFYLETQSKSLFVDAVDYYGDQHNLDEVVNDEEKEKIMDEIEDDIEELNAQDLGDDIADEEGIYGLYSNYDYKENKINDRYDALETIINYY